MTAKYSDSLKRLSYKDENIAVLFSGGMGSFLSAYLLKIQGYANVSLYFNDTLTEDDDLYRFLIECQEFLGYPLVYDADGRDVFDVFIDRKFMGNTRVDPCSETLKRNRSAKWILTTKPSYVVLGIDIWEEDRLTKAKKRQPLFCSALIDAECFDSESLEQEALAISGIVRPQLYDMGFAHNNCGGFCVKAGLGHYKLLWEQDFERYLYFEKREQEVYEAIPTAKPFLRKTINGKLNYLTLREYRTQYLEPSSGVPANDQLKLFSGLDMSLQGCNACAIVA